MRTAPLSGVALAWSTVIAKPSAQPVFPIARTAGPAVAVVVTVAEVAVEGVAAVVSIATGFPFVLGPQAASSPVSRSAAAPAIPRRMTLPRFDTALLMDVIRAPR
ncbi:hypothetical protein GCM10027167_82770 [Nocardia heshunensis]